MSVSGSSTSKIPSLKQPSKIARPTNVLGEKNSDSAPGSTCSSDGLSLRKLSKDVTHKNEFPTIWEDSLRFDHTHSRRESDTSSMLTDDPDSFIVGDRVWVGGTKPGVIAFIGETQFGPGDWAGVVLDEPIGKNDGSIAGIRYFQCAPQKGIFSRLTRLSRFPVDPSQLNIKPTLRTPIGSDRSQLYSGLSPTSSISSRYKLGLPQSYSTLVTSSGTEIKIGDRVIVQSSQGSKAGALRYYGNTEFGTGLWCGVELDDPLGKNDGSVAGIKYFDCPPKYGLFVPAEKISRSPISKKSSCVVHPDGISRQGTLDSIRTNSTIDTNVSSIKSNSRRPSTRSSLTPARTSITGAPKSPLQEQLKEKDEYIKKLLKERELERAEVIRAATQAEEAEKKLSSLKAEYDQICSQYELQKTNYAHTIEKLEKEKTSVEYQLDEEKKKIEDLQFSYEEESITKSEIQALNEEYVEKLKNLEKVVNSQNASLEYEGANSGIFDNFDVVSSTVVEQTAKDLSEELCNSKKLIHVITEQKNELQNECSALKESIEKLKLVEKHKDELINNLKKEAASYQQLEVANASEAVTILNKKLSTLTEENEKLKKDISALKSVDEELSKSKSLLKERENELENIRNNLQFEVDEQKIKVEELTKRTSELSDELTLSETKNKTFLETLMNCSSYLLNDAKKKNDIISQASLGNESSANVLAVLRNKDGNVISKTDGLPAELKDTLLEFEQQIDLLTNNNVLFFEKAETLAEVISRKDSQIEEIIQEKETLRNEFLESMKSKTNEIKNMESKNATLNKEKSDVERQLKINEENVKKIESLSSEKNMLSEEISKKDAQIEDIIREKENLKKEFQDLIENKTSDLKNLEIKYEDLNNVKNEIEQQLRENEENVNKLENALQEKDKLVEEISKKDVEIEGITRKTEALEKEFRASLESKENELKNLETKYEDLNKDRGELETKLRESEENVKKLENVFKDKDKLAEEIAKKDTQIKEVTLEKESLKKEFQELSERRESEIKNLETKNADLSREKSEIEKQLKINEESIKKLESAHNDKEMLAEVVSRKDKQIEEIGLEKESLKKELMESIDSKEKELKILENKFADLNKEKNDIETNLKLNEENAKKLQSIYEEKDKMKEEMESIQKSLESKSSECEKLLQDIITLKEQLTSKEGEIHTCRDIFEKEKETLKTEIKGISEKLHNETEANDILKKDSLQLKTLNELTALLNERMNGIVKSQLANANTEDLNPVSLFENLKAKVESLISENQSKEERLNEMESKYKEYQNKKEVSSHEKAAIEKQLEVICVKLVQFNNLLKRPESETILARENIEGYVDDLSIFLKALQSKYEILENSYKILESSKNELEEQLYKFKEESIKPEELLSKESANQALITEIESLKTELNILKESIRQKDENINTQKLELEQNSAELGKVQNEYKDKEEQYQKVNDEVAVFRQKLLSLQEDFQVKQNQYENEIAEKSKNMKSILLEKENLLQECKSVKMQLESMKNTLDSLKNSNKNNITEHNGFKNGDIKAEKLEEGNPQKKIEATHSANNDNAVNNNTILLGDQNYNKLLEEKELAEGQVKFLNSVIVDMQQKNENLLERIQFLENLDLSDPLTNKKIKYNAPRMFCDICDMFDLHETEDCPKQCDDGSPVPTRRDTPKIKPPPRPYCETCEVFGHSTGECNDKEFY